MFSLLSVTGAVTSRDVSRCKGQDEHGGNSRAC